MGVKSQKKTTIQDSDLKKKWLPIIILVVTVFLYYGNTLKNGYSLDDDLVTTTDNSVHERVEKGISGIPEIFRTHYVVSSKQQYEYRPIVTSSFAIEYQFFGNNTHAKRASISHLISVMLYALLIVLIYMLIFKLFPDRGWFFPFLVALLFLIHPIHSEVVNNIKCRDELFVMIFGILGLFSFLKYLDFEQKKKGYLVVGVLMVILSILSKKVGITFVVLIPLTLYYFRDIKLKKVLILFGLMFVGIFVFYLLKKAALTDGVVREKMFFENPLYFAESKISRVPMFFYSILFYFKMMLVPAPLVYYYGYAQVEIVGWSNPLVWVGVVIVLGGVFFAIKRLAKKEMWAFGFLFFMFGVGGGANFLFPAVGIVAERFVFTGSFGVIFIAVYYGFKWFEKNKQPKGKYVLYGAGALVIIASFSQVVSRNKDWNTRFSLYKNDIKNLDKSAKAHSLLATEYTIKAGLVSRTPNSSYADYIAYVDSAIFEFKRGLEIYDGYYNCANNAGALYFSRKKNYYKAKPLFKKALEYKPEYVEALFNYGNCFESDLRGVKEFQLILDKINIDSLVINNKVSEVDYTIERKASYAIYVVKNEVVKVLRGINSNAPNWKNIAVYQIMSSIKIQLDIEQGVLKSNVDIVGFEAAVKSYINGVNPNNAQNQLQMLMSFCENSLYDALGQYMINERVSLDKNYFNLAKSNMTELKVSLKDSAEHYWYKSLEYDSSYYYSYMSLTNLNVAEGQLEEVLKVNKMAIDHGGFNDNTEFYLNIGNVYNSKFDYPKAVNNMEKAIFETDRVYAKIYNDETYDVNKKQKTLGDLYNKKKQIYGFISKIYFSSGDQVNGVKYQKLSEEL